MAERKPYPTDVSDEEWSFVAPYLILFPLDAGQRRHDLCEVFNALRDVVRTVAPGGCCPTTCLLGRGCISRCSVG